MATLMIFLPPDIEHADPVKDARGCWKQGMIHSVYADGVCVEPPSPDSRFTFIHLPGVPVEDLEKYTRGVNSEILGEQGVLLRKSRREYRIDMDKLPESKKGEITLEAPMTMGVDRVSKYGLPSAVKDAIRSVATKKTIAEAEAIGIK